MDYCTSADANGAACDDGAFCNGTDTCTGGACTAHAGDPCPGADGDGNCSESCNEAADDCTAADSNGSACDDGLFCNGTDTCAGGSCSANSGDPCAGADGDGDCSESCNEAADNCTGADANGSACDDGLFCTQTDTCSGGSCVGNGDPCSGGTECNDACNEAADDCADASGTACTSDGNGCTDDKCDGSGGCAHSNNTAPCDDGVACTTVDTCAGGTCFGSLPPQCDDSNPCTIDSCDDEAGCVNAEEPTDGCLGALRGQFQVKDKADDRKDKLQWKWKRGDATSLDDFGDPVQSTAYTLCVYDESAGQSSLVTRLTVEPSASWTPAGKKGKKYKDKTGLFDGVQRGKLKSGATGKSQAQVKGKGANLPMPVPVGGGKYFNVDDAVTVQLLNTEGVCWTTKFLTPKKNTEQLFKAKFK
jgi:hypothetical protein